MTDYKQLCAELLAALESWSPNGGAPLEEGAEAIAEARLIERARAALSQPEPAGLSDEELLTVQRAVLTRWGRQVPMESKFNIKWALDALERLRDASMRYRLGVFSQEELQLYEDRAQKVIEAWGRGDEHEMSGSDATPQPVPPEPGEVQGLVEWLLEEADDYDCIGETLAPPKCRRIAELLSQQYAQPVPVSERLPGPGDCDAEGRCWWWNPTTITLGTGWWSFEPYEWMEDATHWLPAHALPMPGEVEG